jgi:hypothetical protein
MKKYTAAFLIALGLTTLPSAWADSYTFSVIPPSGDITGPPGSTIGWGYSIDNLSTNDWLVTTALNADPFLNVTPNSLFDFPDLPPLTTATEAFDPIGGTGLYELTWDSTAPIGFTNLGVFTLSADFYSGDPTAGGSFVGSAPDTTAGYSATVVTPEPSTLIPLAVCSLLLMSLRRRTRQRNPLL